MLRRSISRVRLFQSTPPRGWRPSSLSLSWIFLDFNPLHHEGGDSSNLGSSPGSIDFNPLHHEGGDVRIPVPSQEAEEDFNPLHHEGGDPYQQVRHILIFQISIHSTTRVETIYQSAIRNLNEFQSTPPRGWRQQYYTITTTILQHISTNKSYPTPSNHGQPSLHTRKSVLIVQIFRCESPRKSMFASGSHQNTLYRFTARGQVRISAVLPH